METQETKKNKISILTPSRSRSVRLTSFVKSIFDFDDTIEDLLETSFITN